MSSTRIALDAMGGDDAPAAVLDGALAALAGDGALSAEQVILVGDSAAIEAHLDERGGNPGFEVLAATEVVEMGEDPRRALRSKPDNSISVAVGCVKAGRASGLVSMGNTGMVVAASTLLLGRLKGVRMPAIAVTVGVTGSPMVLLDMGANIEASPENLEHNALMGSIYAQDCLGIAAPRVGLLNVGEEAEKGPKRLKETHLLLEELDLDFIGNVEGGDVFGGGVDVVVTDGFTGNVILKLLEQFGGFVIRRLVGASAQEGVEVPGVALQAVMQDLDYATYGGALLLGVNGVVVIGHGRSDARAVANALKQAARAVDAGVNGHILAGLAGRRADCGEISEERTE